MSCFDIFWFGGLCWFLVLVLVSALFFFGSFHTTRFERGDLSMSFFFFFFFFFLFLVRICHLFLLLCPRSTHTASGMRNMVAMAV